jgi:hypothetical protein
MSYPQALSVAVYIISAGVFTAAILFALQGKALCVKALLLGLLLACILFVAVLELPITRMPFWSRDFSLTWTMAVLALAVAVVSLRPRILASMRKRFGKCQEASVSPLYGTEFTLGASSNQEVVCTSVGISNGRVEPMPSTNRRTASRTLLFLGVLGAGVVLATLYWRGAEQNLIRANTDPTRVDQGAYINYAEKILKEDYSHVGNRNRMPLYPFVLSFVLNPEDSLAAEFVRAKYFSLALSIALLLAIGALFLRLFSPLEAVTLLLTTAFSLYIFKAAYVNTELLYYTLAAFLFFIMLRYLVKPSVGLAVATGILAGLTHLAKASAPPALGLFLVVAFTWGVALILRGAKQEHIKLTAAKFLPLAANVALVVGFFLLTVFPYIKNSWYRFGSPFYNVNSTFYVWYDTWEEVKRGTNAHGDRVGWPDMPASEIPSFGKYMREHTPKDMVDRVLTGTSRTIQEAKRSYGYAKYVFLFSLVLVVAVSLNRRRFRESLSRYPHVIAFAAVYFLMYAMLNAWFYDFVDGNRLALAQYVPLLLACALGIRYLLHERTLKAFARGADTLNILYALILIVVILDIHAVVTNRILSMFGGS